MRRAVLILVTLLLIGTAISCDGESLESFAADKMVESFYEAINDGDTAKAQGYVSAGNSLMLELTEAMVSVMAGKIQKVEILDIIRAEGQFGGPPSIGVSVRITCAGEVPTFAPGYPTMWSPGHTCGDVDILLYKWDSGWKIETTS
jgi:hypothetical protein